MGCIKTYSKSKRNWEDSRFICSCLHGIKFRFSKWSWGQEKHAYKEIFNRKRPVWKEMDGNLLSTGYKVLGYTIFL